MIDSETGEPIVGAQVSFGLRGEGEEVVARRAVRTDSEGAFEVKGLCEGSHILVAEAEGHLRKEEAVDLAPDGERDFSIALEEGIQLLAGSQIRFQIQVEGGTLEFEGLSKGNALILGGNGKAVKLLLIGGQPETEGQGVTVEQEGQAAEPKEAEDPKPEPAPPEGGAAEGGQ